MYSTANSHVCEISTVTSAPAEVGIASTTSMDPSSQSQVILRNSPASSPVSVSLATSVQSTDCPTYTNAGGEGSASRSLMFGP